MSENRSESILKLIKSAYEQQFEQTLDDRFLMEVVEQELQKKREAFLQVQLATSGLSISEMTSLKNFLTRDRTDRKPFPREAPRDGSASTANAVATLASLPAGKLPRSERSNEGGRLKGLSVGRGKAKAPDLASYDADLEADVFTDADEEPSAVKKEKRRAYARAYYHRKKNQRERSDGKSAKKFKTTPEQRAYQRAYYQRKKAEQGDEESGALAKVAAKALRAQKQAMSRPEAVDSRRGRKSKADFDSLTADRIAIEQAFRPSGDEARGGHDHAEHEGLLSSLALHPKVKLRKATNKAGSLSP